MNEQYETAYTLFDLKPALYDEALRAYTAHFFTVYDRLENIIKKGHLFEDFIEWAKREGVEIRTK